MGLSDDQRAMLRLLAQRGEQGYEDIAALMGLSVEEVRAKVAAALAELDEEGALGAAAREAAPKEAAAPDEATPAAAEAASTPPPQPSTPPAPAASAPAAPEPRSAERKLSLPEGQRLWAAVAGVVIVVALIVIGVIVVNSGGDSEPATAASGSTGASETATTSENASSAGGNSTDPSEVTKAALEPVDGSEATGVAIFGRVKESESLALEVAAEGLQPTQSGESYTLWLSQGKTSKKMVPLARTPAKKGRIAAQFEIPTEVLVYLADETFTDLVLTRTKNSTLNAALKTATEEKTTPTYTGTEVLRGTVTGPIVGAAARLEELEAEEKSQEKGE